MRDHLYIDTSKVSSAASTLAKLDTVLKRSMSNAEALRIDAVARLAGRGGQASNSAQGLGPSQRGDSSVAAAGMLKSLRLLEDRMFNVERALSSCSLKISEWTEKASSATESHDSKTQGGFTQ